MRQDFKEIEIEFEKAVKKYLDLEDEMTLAYAQVFKEMLETFKTTLEQQND